MAEFHRTSDYLDEDEHRFARLSRPDRQRQSPNSCPKPPQHESTRATSDCFEDATLLPSTSSFFGSGWLRALHTEKGVDRLSARQTTIAIQGCTAPARRKRDLESGSHGRIKQRGGSSNRRAVASSSLATVVNIQASSVLRKLDERPKRGARVEMHRKNILVDLPKSCARCCRELERSDWFRCNTCADVNLCITCATSATNRHRCLDDHTFTPMFRIYELGIRNSSKHDHVLKRAMKRDRYPICDNCEICLSTRSWVRCNACSDFDLCLKCWASKSREHCLTLGWSHTFTNMCHRYRIKVAPTCALLCEEDQTLSLFERVGVNVGELRLNSKYDRAYCSPTCDLADTNREKMHTTWTANWFGASSKIIPYYCPVGWRRFSLRSRGVDFENSVTVYHGTRAGVIAKISRNGLLARECQHGCSAAYVSPSIPYCAHPRYARVVRMQLLDDRVVYVQFVAELRVNLVALQTRRASETLSVGGEGTIDSNFLNNEGLELLLCKEPSGSYLTTEDGVRLTGVMVRVLDHDPLEEADSWWWTKWKSAGYLRKNYYSCESGLEYPDEPTA